MKVRIEMEVPDDADTSELLERFQDMAVELHNEFDPDDDEDEPVRETDYEAIRDLVSIQIVSMDPVPHDSPWECGHKDPIYINRVTQQCAICGLARKVAA